MISNAYFGRKPFLVFSERSPPRSRERHANVDARSFLARLLPLVREGAESTDRSTAASRFSQSKCRKPPATGPVNQPWVPGLPIGSSRRVRIRSAR